MAAGGGGDKKTNPRAFLDKGISVAAINYRYTQNGVEDKVEPPVKAPLGDAARALQFVRSKAAEWNLDKQRIGATGGSAGACTSLWLAFHDDMADPKSDDPVARESTRPLLRRRQRSAGIARSAGIDGSGCRTTVMAPTPSVCRTFRA